MRVGGAGGAGEAYLSEVWVAPRGGGADIGVEN